MMKKYLLVPSLMLALLVTTGSAYAAMRVACIGDSITYGVNLPPDQTYPADLQRSLGPNAVVKIFAFPGLSLLSLPNGNPPYHPAYVGTQYYQQALQFNPNIVIIMLGTNDGSFTSGIGQHWTQAYGHRFADQYKSLVDRFRRLPAHPQVFLATCPMVFGVNQYAIDPDTVNNTISPDIIKIGMAVRAPIIDVHHATAPCSADFGDKVHPNLHGAMIIAQAVYLSLKNKALAATVSSSERRPSQAPSR